MAKKSAAKRETRYSPARCIGCEMKTVNGNPDPMHVSTSFVERQNLRFTRLTNAFSKKIENHAAAVAIWFMYYNFCREHSTLRVTPAMESGPADHVWSIEEMCGPLPKAVSATPDRKESRASGARQVVRFQRSPNSRISLFILGGV